MEAARTVRPDLPITATILEHNLASRAVVGKSGLVQVWRGPDAGNPDPDAVRLIYTDRQLSPKVVKMLGNAE